MKRTLIPTLFVDKSLVSCHNQGVKRRPSRPPRNPRRHSFPLGSLHILLGTGPSVAGSGVPKNKFPLPTGRRAGDAAQMGWGSTERQMSDK